MGGFSWSTSLRRGVHHGERSVVYQASYEEHCDIVYGRKDLLGLCQRLVQDAWGAPVQASAKAPAAISDARASAREALERALALCIARGERGDSIEPPGRPARTNHREVERASFEWALRYDQ